MSNKLGILVYVDNSDSMVEEFSWLYKSAIYSGVLQSSTIIAVCHPEVRDRLPSDSRILAVEKLPFASLHSEWNDYKFINSVGSLAEQDVLNVCEDFDVILKTDCDTFVTPAMNSFRPSALCFGFGAYAYEDSVRIKLSECSRRWGYPHGGLHNVGASVLGPSEMVRNYLQAHMQCCDRLLEEEFKDFQGEWPFWSKQVLTMYAGELALRQTYPQACSVGFLDHFTRADRRLGSDVLHIHAWHTDSYWSKHHFRGGKYSGMKLEDIDRDTLGGYCHWLAAADLDQVKSAAAA
ncbi:hypothetical protein AWB77_02198 [Caballeronia fortuita]|uniref:DUF7164 domain-containing protein n=1 Tax=Caballeronia fortuita TaxID=1777138 RepID=A0A158AWS4_9BURK|nr:hypothetical protein [Caballeronia fortuita]SAK62193.1 hypothetical protein AWB77_02198 [Caballeronia fortuita]